MHNYNFKLLNNLKSLKINFNNNYYMVTGIFARVVIFLCSLKKKKKKKEQTSNRIHKQ